MKKYLPFFLLSLFLLTRVHAQTYTSSCVPTGNTKALFWQDAYLLAIKRVNDIGSTWKDSVMLPALYVDSFANALYAIQNMQSAPVKDTILSLFGYDHFVPNDDSLHIYSPDNSTYAFNVKSIQITVQNNTGWAMDWASGNYNNTSNDTINYLVNTLGLSVTLNSAQFYTDKTIYIIRASFAINTPALVNKFAGLAGVYYSNVKNTIGDGPSITANINSGNIYLTYKYGCGDCPSGCTYGREWHFEVNTGSDCSVTYLSENNWGNPILWSLSGSCFDALVPVEFTSVQVSQLNNYPFVKWQVAGETAIAEYVVERSENGIDYNAVGEVTAYNSQSLATIYSWIDNSFFNTKEYYRIKSVGKNGAIKYSSVVNLAFNTNASIIVYPTLLTTNKLTLRSTKRIHTPIL